MVSSKNILSQEQTSDLVNIILEQYIRATTRATHMFKIKLTGNKNSECKMINTRTKTLSDRAIIALY